MFSSIKTFILVRTLSPLLRFLKKMTVISLFLCLQFVDLYLIDCIQTLKTLIKLTQLCKTFGLSLKCGYMI